VAYLSCAIFSQMCGAQQMKAGWNSDSSRSRSSNDGKSKRQSNFGQQFPC